MTFATPTCLYLMHVSEKEAISHFSEIYPMTTTWIQLNVT